MIGCVVGPRRASIEKVGRAASWLIKAFHFRLVWYNWEPEIPSDNYYGKSETREEPLLVD